MHNPIIKPIITEKSMTLAHGGKFSFVVHRFASKMQIKKAVEKTFSVNVVGVTTTVVKGKTKRVGMRRSEIKESPYKKAVVALKAGQKIGLFELGGESA